MIQEVYFIESFYSILGVNCFLVVFLKFAYKHMCLRVSNT
jgi:hypothetical protein